MVCQVCSLISKQTLQSSLHDDKTSYRERFARNEGLSVVDMYNDLMVCVLILMLPCLSTDYQQSLTAITHPALFNSTETWKATADCPGIGQVFLGMLILSPSQAVSSCCYCPHSLTLHNEQK
jgi:hypothetical protein